MKVTYKVNDDCTVEQEVSSVTQGFEFIAYATEVFGVKKCGNCSSPNLKLVHRTPQGYDYYDVKCRDCNHELKFGQVKDTGHLFPKGWEPPYSSDEDVDAPSKSKKRPAKKPRRRPPEDEYEDDDYDELVAAGPRDDIAF